MVNINILGGNNDKQKNQVRSSNQFNMINIKITMVDGTEYNIRNSGDNVKDAFKRIIAPYGTNMSFVEILPGTLISVKSIVSFREMSDEEVAKLNEAEEVVGLTETDVEVEGDGDFDDEDEESDEEAEESE